MVVNLRRPRVVILLASVVAVLVAAWPIIATAATDPFNGGSNTAGNFAILAGTTVTNSGPTVVKGQIGVAPGSAITGFPPGTSGVQHRADAVAITAQTDLTAAYLNAQGQACPPANDKTGQNLGGMTLTPGVYCQTTAPTLTGTLTLSGSGVYIFQIGTVGAPTTLVTAPNAVVSLTGGALECQVFWVVTSSATLDTTTTFVGNIMALQSITVNNGVNLVGRALARNGQVSLINDVITQPTGCGYAAPAASPTPATPTPAPTVGLPNTGGPPDQPGLPWWPVAALVGAGATGALLFGLRNRFQKRDS
jgi:hypothetical protein